jgi:hypothetical protein
MSTFFAFLAIHKTFFQDLRILGFQFSFEVEIHSLHHYFLTLGVIGELISGHFLCQHIQPFLSGVFPSAACHSIPQH